VNASQAYQTLQLKDSATPEEIKSAYRRLALESHPDKNSKNKDDAQFKRVTEAYNVLKGRHKSGAVRQRPKPPQKKTSPWGATADDGPPGQDWGKFTREFEEGDPAWWKEYEEKFWKEYDRTVNADGRNGEFEKAQEAKVQPDLSVEVDPSLCIGCCSCEIIAPDVFRVDKKSQTNPKSKVINPKGSGVNKIMNAAETCPTRAINVRDRGTGEGLYPP